MHDCPGQGILGADRGSGSFLLEYVEVHHTGAGTSAHQIRMATDEVAHPGSVFRMQYCYVHDANGGNNVKSRAQRNEIRYNWIEGALYHEIELIGPDGADEGLFREDSDVVGNVFRKTATTVRGYPDNPLSWDEVVEKFRSCCEFTSPQVEPRRQNAIIERVAALETLSNVGEIAALLGAIG